MSIQQYWNRSGMLYPDPESDSTFVALSGPVVTYEDHVKSVNMAAMKAYAYLALNGNRDAAEKISQIILEAGR